MAPRIQLYGLRHLRDNHAAADLTQQVLIITLEALRAGRLREPEKLASFVLGACRMTVLDLRRNVQRKARLLEQFGADLIAPAPEPYLDHYRCVQNLKERERAVVIMTFYDEQTGADYWSVALAKSEEEAVEEHLFSCDGCEARLGQVIMLAKGIRKLAHEGSLIVIVSDAFVKRAKEQGLHVREYAPPPSGSAQCTVTAEDDLLIGHLTAELRGAKRIDLCLCDGQRIERHRLPDIPFDSEAGGVRLQQSITYAKAAPSETVCSANIPSTTHAPSLARAPGSRQLFL